MPIWLLCYLKSAMMKTVLALSVACVVLGTAMTGTAFAASKNNQVNIRDVPPKNPVHERIYTELKQRGALEKLQIFFSPFRLPSKLRISLEGCDGEPGAHSLRSKDRGLEFRRY
jgi:hypothetical protein